MNLIIYFYRIYLYMKKKNLHYMKISITFVVINMYKPPTFPLLYVSHRILSIIMHIHMNGIKFLILLGQSH